MVLSRVGKREPAGKSIALSLSFSPSQPPAARARPPSVRAAVCGSGTPCRTALGRPPPAPHEPDDRDSCRRSASRTPPLGEIFSLAGRLRCDASRPASSCRLLAISAPRHDVR